MDVATSSTVMVDRYETDAGHARGFPLEPATSDIAVDGLGHPASFP